MPSWASSAAPGTAVSSGLHTPSTAVTARFSLAAALLVLAGCDRFEEPGAGSPPPVTAPAVPVQAVYVKGVPTLDVGQQAEFRTESVPGAVSYHWTGQGTGSVVFAASPDDEAGLGRIVTLGGARSGPTVVEATAMDAQRRVVARGSRTVEVR